MNSGNDVSILLIGKSGAGKSEFISSFSKNSKYVNSSGDGQTTRTNIEYHFISNQNIRPCVKVVLLTQEEFVTKRLNQIKRIEIPKGPYDLSVKQQVLEIDGFFNYKEFDFYDDSCSSKIDLLWEKVFSNIYKEEYSKDEYEEIRNKTISYLKENPEIKDTIINKIPNLDKDKYMIGDIVEVILHAVYIICKKSINEYPLKYNLNQLSTCEEHMLTCCLKVDDEGNSVTGLVSTINIIDNVCEAYSDIFQKLKVNQLTFIDTYGLDHDDGIDEGKLRLRYEALFNEYPNIETVFFIRALGSDSPSDLELCIPMIYTVQPSVIPYVLFSKIDDNNRINLLDDKQHIDLIILNKQKKINAVDYFINDKTSMKIKRILYQNEIPEVLIESRYNVLINNLTPYCSKHKDEYKDNNKYYINRLLKSIVNKEHLGKEYINIDRLSKIDNKEITLVLLRNMFREASRKWSSTSGRTSGANAWRLGVGILGYNGTYSDAWCSRFNVGYNNVFAKLDEVILDLWLKISKDTKEASAIREILNRFSKYLLGCSNNEGYRFRDSVACEDCLEQNKSCCFKTLLVKANPEINEQGMFEPEYPLYIWLDRVYNFESYFEEIQEDVYRVFIDKFKKYFINECRQHNARLVANEISSSLCDDRQMYVDKYLQEYESDNLSIFEKRMVMDLIDSYLVSDK